jgi:hypothetical protein
VSNEEELIKMIKECEPTDHNVSRVSQTALHDGLALFAEDVDLTQEKSIRWLYGLLCVLEKPLLPDQAADLNVLLTMLNKLRAQNT